MFALTLKLLPLGLIGIASPALISLSILMLSSKRPLANANAFALGTIVILLSIGTSVLVLFHGHVGLPEIEIRRSTSVLLGVLLVISGVKYYFRMPDSDAPPPQWTKRVAGIVPYQAFLLGLLMTITNLKLLAGYTLGINAIVQAQVGLLVGLIMLAYLLLLLLLGLLLPIAIYLANPRKAANLLLRLQNWMADASRVLLTLILVGVGFYFVVNGLLSH